MAKENMPISSVVIGVDLYPIKPINGCISLTEDITTEKCRSALTKELQGWKADVVLHDGAPNVGKNWLFDAYQQICLTLSAAKLASQYLRSGGWFITKVFRSKDYNALLWVLKQLFKKVHATKPSASRKESAEIFVVCQFFIAPDKIDPRFFEAKYVFEELDLEGSKQVSLLHPEKKRIKAEGYSENDFSLRNELPVSQFIKNVSALTALNGIGEIVFDDDRVKNHAKTTDEIRECCKDIKVLGRKDLRSLLAWWKILRAEFYPKQEVKEIADADETTERKKPLTQQEVEDMEFEEIEQQIQELEVEDEKDQKRKKKRVQEARRKLNEKLNLKMVIKGDSGPQEEDSEIFSLRQINSSAQLESLQDMPPDMYLPEEDQNTEFIAKYKKYESDRFHLDDNALYDDEDAAGKSDGDSDASDDSEDSEKLGKSGLGFSDNEDEEKIEDKRVDGRKQKKQKKVAKTENPLLTDLDHRDKNTKREQRVNLWFEKDALKDLDASDVDEDYDLNNLTNQYKSKGVHVLGESSTLDEVRTVLGKKARRRERHLKNGGSDGDDTHGKSSSDSDSEDEIEAATSANAGTSGEKRKKIKLNEQELALGSLMVQSQRTKRDLFDSAWNRYTFNDENLPEWFVQDEAQHMVKEAPVPKELIEEYQQKVDELNVRPIKKVMEAKARKKRRAMKRFEKAKKKAEAILESGDNSSQEKMRQIRKYVKSNNFEYVSLTFSILLIFHFSFDRLYKKAQDKKEEVTYVVTRRHLASKRVRRPNGVKGRFKVVDPRMKKEKRAAKAKEKTKNRRR